MKIIDKYQKLQNNRFVADMITQSVYGTMQLEHQPVPLETVRKAVQRACTKRTESVRDGVAGL